MSNPFADIDIEPKSNAKAKDPNNPFADITLDGSSSTPSVKSEDKGIPHNRKFQHSDSWLGRALESFDWIGNASRSGISNAIRGGDFEEGAKQGLAKEKQTTPTQLKDDITRKLFGGTYRFGKDDGQFQFTDFYDITSDIAVDVATDPLSYVPLVGWGAKAAGIGGKAAKAGMALTALDKGIAPAAMGAIYGAGSSGKDDDTSDMIKRGLAGAVGGVALRNSGKALKPLLYGEDLAKGVEGKNGLLDSITDYVAHKSGKVEKGTKVGRASRIGDAAFDKLQRKAASIFFNRNNAIGLDDLSEAERWELDDVLKQLKDGTAEFRKNKFKELGIHDTKLMDEMNPSYQNTFNKVTKEANEYAEKELFPKIMKDKSDKIKGAVEGMAKHNEDLVKQYNQFKFGIDEATDDGTGLVGLKYHTDDLKYSIPDKDAKALDNIFSNAKFDGAEVKEFTNATSDRFKSLREAGVSPDDRYAEYSRKFAQNFLDNKEVEALDIMFKHTNTPAKEGGWAMIENGGKVFDKANNWVKKNLLFASLTWMKNNFWDNLAKSYVENGLYNAAGTAKNQIPALKVPFTNFTTGTKLNRDLMDIYKGNIDNVLPKKQYDKLLIEAIEDGATEGPMMTNVIGNKLEDALKQGDTVKDLSTGSGSLMDKTMRLADKWGKGLERTTGVIGSGMEGAARFTLYKNMREQLTKQGLPVDQARKKAAQVVKDTFFNYGEMTKLERDFAKRLMPFYAFYSKNLPYWVQTGLNPEKAARLFKLQKIPNNIGEKPTEREQRGVPDYLKKNNARILGRNKEGKVMGYMPTMSIYDAIQMGNVDTLGEQLKEKISPLIKMPFETPPPGLGVPGHDFFLDQPTYPSDRLGGERPLFSSGHKYHLLNMLPGQDPMYLNSKGTPQTDSDLLTGLEKFSSNAQIPIIGSPITGQIAGSIGNMVTGRKSKAQAISELLSPVKSTLLTPEQEGKNIRYKAEAKAKERKKEARDAERRRKRRRKK